MTDNRKKRGLLFWARAIALLAVAAYFGKMVWSLPRTSWSLKDPSSQASITKDFDRKSISPEKIKHVILISIDTCRTDHMGCYGYSRNTTPNIDAFAGDSIVFNHTITPVPLTLPAHSSMMTGTTPLYHNVHDNTGYRLDESNTTLAEILKENGFSTEAVIASYVLDKQGGLDQGFDIYDDNLKGVRSTGMVTENERNASEVTVRGLEWIERNHSKKSFLFLHYYDPHWPWEAPEQFRYTSGIRVTPKDQYDAELAYTDYYIGKLINKLKQKGIYDSSLIIITSDHGESIGDHGESTHGFFVYHSTVHVPLIIKIPGLSGSARINEVTGLIDIVPTVCSILGINPPSAVQGEDLTAFLGKQKPAKPERYLYSESWEPVKFGCARLQAITTNRHKYIQTVRSELYDLAIDPREKRDLIKRDPDLANKLDTQVTTLTGKAVIAAENTVKLDEESLNRLASLGYVQGDTDPGSGPNESKIDPKDMIEFSVMYLGLKACILQQKHDDAVKVAYKIMTDYPDRKDPSLTVLADILARHPNSKIRDAKAAIKIAEHVAELNEYKDIDSLNALAAGHAAAGHFTQAQKLVEEALKLAKANGKQEAIEEIQKRMDLYKQKKLYLKIPSGNDDMLLH
jgi:arylsulfatase A-like enzyme